VGTVYDVQSPGKSVSNFELWRLRLTEARIALRVISLSDGPGSPNPGHKSSVGRGGHRIDNFWEGSGLKIDSASTDIAWGRGGMFFPADYSQVIL
jgi:hypothetical protein